MGKKNKALGGLREHDGGARLAGVTIGRRHTRYAGYRSPRIERESDLPCPGSTRGETFVLLFFRSRSFRCTAAALNVRSRAVGRIGAGDAEFERVCFPVTFKGEFSVDKLSFDVLTLLYRV